MQCKVIVNTDSGNCSKLNLNKILPSIGCSSYDVQNINSGTDIWQHDGYDNVVVCGGDGTLNNAVNNCLGKNIYYVPCGTLNESTCLGKQISRLGCVNEQLFCYVCATGSFCPIGYSTKPCNKQKHKYLAYLCEATKCVNVCNVPATLNIDGARYDGTYTLLMVLQGKQCCNFNFNKCKQDGLYLLAVKSFGNNNFANKVKLLSTFFRIFCLGLTKPTTNKRFLFVPFERLNVSLSAPQEFCIDGEKRILQSDLHFGRQQLDSPITVVNVGRGGATKRKKTVE